jgi:carboxymethylenebutenolidase
MTITASISTLGGLNVSVARPEGATAGVLLLPSIMGLSPNLGRWAESIASLGLAAVAWDPFRGRDVQGLAIQELMPLVAEVTDDQTHAEQATLIDAMTGELALERVGVIGWCYGGRLALNLAAREPRLACCASYHPSIRPQRGPHQTDDTLALAAEIGCPVQVVYPGADQVMTPDLFAALRDALERRASGATDTQLYPGADHGFMDRPTSEANRTATRLAWPQTLAFLQANLE